VAPKESVVGDEVEGKPIEANDSPTAKNNRIEIIRRERPDRDINFRKRPKWQEVSQAAQSV
jgi:hypothetical protein